MCRYRPSRSHRSAVGALVARVGGRRRSLGGWRSPLAAAPPTKCPWVGGALPNCPQRRLQVLRGRAGAAKYCLSGVSTALILRLRQIATHARIQSTGRSKDPPGRCIKHSDLRCEHPDPCRARETLAQPPSFHLRQRITLRAPPRKALRPHWRNQEVACPPQPGHVPGGSGRSPGVVVGVGCGLLRAAGRVVRLGRWGVYRCWSLVARLGHWVGSQVARVVGMASSRYQVQKARRAGTSVSSSGCQFRAPAAALAQL